MIESLMKIKLPLILSLLIVFALASSQLLLADEPAGYSENNPLRVGVILPLSGEHASIGDGFQRAIKMAQDDLEEEARRSIRFYFEDDGMVARNAVGAFHKLVNQDQIEVLINLSSGTGNALAPLAEQRGIPFLAVATDPKVVEGRKNVFNFWVTPTEQANLAVPEALRRGYRRIARVTTIHDGTYAVNKEFDPINDNQIKIVIDEEYPIDVTDFRTVIARIRQTPDLDAIFLLLFKGQLSSFALQARQSGIDLPFFGYEFMEDINEIRAAQGTLEGAWYVNAADASDDFISRFQQLNPDASLYTAANGYDAVLLLAEAIKTAKSRAEIVEFLAGLKDFTGALGTYSSTGDQRFSLPAALKIVDGGQGKPLEVNRDE